MRTNGRNGRESSSLIKQTMRTMGRGRGGGWASHPLPSANGIVGKLKIIIIIANLQPTGSITGSLILFFPRVVRPSQLPSIHLSVIMCQTLRYSPQMPYLGWIGMKLDGVWCCKMWSFEKTNVCCYEERIYNKLSSSPAHQSFHHCSLILAVLWNFNG